MQFQVDRAIQRLVCESNVAAQAATDPNVRFWPKADIPSCTAHVRFRGKADIAFCGANVCFRPIADIPISNEGTILRGMSSCWAAIRRRPVNV